jgi:DNA-binding response OmpR family regulator
VRVLVVEDDLRVANLVERTLAEAGYQAYVTVDGAVGLDFARSNDYDLILLDVLLPRIDGLEICRQLRAQKIRTPILMLTARDAVADRVRGLDAGADDYLTKPFALEELLARIRALARRGRGEPDEETLRIGDLTLNASTYEVQRGGRAIDLTAKEFALLQFLMKHPGRVLTKDQILNHVWGYDADVVSNVVEIYIHYLRDRVDRGFPRPLIRTVRGVGYTVKM